MVVCKCVTFIYLLKIEIKFNFFNEYCAPRREGISIANPFIFLRRVRMRGGMWGLITGIGFGIGLLKFEENQQVK